MQGDSPEGIASKAWWSVVLEFKATRTVTVDALRLSGRLRFFTIAIRGFWSGRTIRSGVVNVAIAVLVATTSLAQKLEMSGRAELPERRSDILAKKAATAATLATEMDLVVREDCVGLGE